jgi:hypothetical protein
VSASFAGDANHTGSSNTGSFTIGQAGSTVTVVCPTTPQTYTGAAMALCTATSTGAGMTPVDVTGSIIYGNNINVGTATASASWAGDGNHSGNSGSGSFSIGRAPSTVTVTCPTTAQTYTGAAITACTAKATGAGIATPINVAVSYTNNINVGTATASASWAGDGNHSGNSGSGSFSIGPAPTTVLYTGDQIVTTPSSFTLSAQVTGPASCPAASYALDRNPLTGAAVAYALTPGSVPTTNWLDGTYQITVTYGGGNCRSSTDQATLTVATPGDVAYGGGWYTLTTNGRVSFGFTVRKVANTNPAQYTGQIYLINKGKWRLKGTLSSYGLAGSTGISNGTGSLYWWNPALDGGEGGWATASSNVSFTISFTATTKTAAGSFGIKITYTPVSPQPSTLPNSSPTTLKWGRITAN